MTTTDAEPVITYRQAEVRAVARPTPRTVRVTFGDPDAGELATMPVAAPDGYLKLFFPRPGTTAPELPPQPTGPERGWYRDYLAMPDDVRPPMRTYTLRSRRVDPLTGAVEFDVDFVLHPSGPACEWAVGARPGARIAFTGPYGVYAPGPEHDRVVLVGDETAVPAMAAIVESGGAHPVTTVAEVHDEAEHHDWDRHGATATWLSTPAGRPSRLLDAVRALDLGRGRPYVWLAGESTLVKALRRHLVREVGVPRSDVCFVGYWRRGITEEQAVAEAMAAAARGEDRDEI